MAAACPPCGCGRPGAQHLLPRGLRRTQPGEEPAGAVPAEGPESADPRVRELRARLELELRQQRQEQCECVLKRKEQHLAEVPGRGRGESDNPPKPTPSARRRAPREARLLTPSFFSLQQIAKMMELAREKQAAELKTLKETSERYACLPPKPDSQLPGGLRPPQNMWLGPPPQHLPDACLSTATPKR